MPKSNLPIVMVSEENILEKIYLIRGQKVMLDRDLAEMYGVEVRVLNQAVKRNSTRFPEDFMFQINRDEFQVGEDREHFLMSLQNKALQCYQACSIQKPPYK